MKFYAQPDPTHPSPAQFLVVFLLSGWCPDGRGRDILAAAVNALNENTSHVALGKILHPFNILLSMNVRIDRPVAWWPHRDAAPKHCSPIAL